MNHVAADVSPRHIPDRKSAPTNVGGYGTHSAVALRSCQRLLGLAAISPRSFVGQCFPIASLHARAFAAEVERRHGRPWYEAIMATTDLSEISGFSEYETLGTYLTPVDAGGVAV